MADFYVSLEELRTVGSQLGDIIAELGDASSETRDLERAIAQPYWRSELAVEAGEFESQWSYHRGKLEEGLGEIKEHVDAIVEAVDQLDCGASGAFEEASSAFAIQLEPKK
ncbi:MAG TPA: hypothetical protein VK086_04845 [Ruania sp.]|nr:hypothetical protein [Ruania sp.]